MTFSDHVFQSELFKSTYRSFVASQQEKHDAGKVNVLLSLSQKLLKKKFFFAKMAIFRVFVLCRPNCWSLRSNPRTFQRKSIKRAIECAYLRRFCSSGSRVMSRFVEKCRKRQNLIFGDLWWPDLWPDPKMLKQLRYDFWRSFKFRLQRVATWPRPPPPARRVWRRAHARRGLTFAVFSHVPFIATCHSKISFIMKYCMLEWVVDGCSWWQLTLCVYYVIGPVGDCPAASLSSPPHRLTRRQLAQCCSHLWTRWSRGSPPAGETSDLLTASYRLLATQVNS